MPLRLIAWLALMASPAVAEFPVRHCIALGNALESPDAEGEWGHTIARADLTAIADAGFDTVRLPVRFETRWQDGAVTPTFIARVDQVLRWGLDAGLTMILDMHHHEALMTDPDGQAQTFVDQWSWLSAHYADWPDTLIFELLNEPTDAMTTARAVALYTQAIPLIRARNPDRWVIIAGDGWSAWPSLADLPSLDARTVPTFHYYVPWDFTHQEATWITDPPPPNSWPQPGDKAALAADLAAAATLSPGAFMGEFGVLSTVPAGDRLDWIRSVRSGAEAQGLPWCLWSFGGPFGVYTNGDWMPGILPALFD